jgi:hypothetical protein
MDFSKCNKIKTEIMNLNYLKDVHCYEKGSLNEFCVKISYNIWLNKINYYNYCVNKIENKRIN